MQAHAMTSLPQRQENVIVDWLFVSIISFASFVSDLFNIIFEFVFVIFFFSGHWINCFEPFGYF